MTAKILYQTEATANGGRTGRVHSADGAVDMPLVMPKEMGGSGEKGANPETLFACGYAACFESACRFLARKEGLSLGDDTHVTAKVGIGPRAAGGFQLYVTLEAHLAGLSQEQAEQIAHTAHNEVCPYSHATRGNIAVQVEII
ncbi:MAG: organic hydroperoxide resistance protein [Candidatus Tokpelaia sp.]|nr:MAG: organic hydroperoxide resistance protein [Candidatus Tokpelaia sp.]KAA6206949.1 MAG: organic hydroperoxide resistance protein [Candidatus Tokpelaia sp.]